MMTKKLIVVKALTYKLLTTVFLVTVAFWRFGSIKTALTIGIGDAIVKMILYSMHEGVWSRVLARKAARS